MRGKTIIVAGAGLGGLSAALRLAQEGHKVTVVDQRTGPGGKAFQQKIGGYRFDTGPSLFTMKGVFQDLFLYINEDLDQHIKLVPLKDSLCHYFWDDGERLEMPGSIDAAARALETKGWAESEAVKRFFAHGQELQKKAGDLFLFENIHKKGFFAQPRIWWKMLNLMTINPLRPMKKGLEAFFKHPKVLQLFQRYATYNGSHPERTPGTLNLIPYVEYGLGAFDVQGGIYSIPQTLEKLAKERGVEFHYNQKIKGFLEYNGNYRGIETETEKYIGDAVVSNIDVRSTYKILGDPPTKWFRRYSHQEPSSSGFVFYWGMSKKFPELGLHNIFFSQDYHQEFEALFGQPAIYKDPTVYVNISSKTTDGDAPPNGENWFVLVNSPYHQDQNWTSLGDDLKRTITEKLSKVLDKDVAAAIEVEGRLSPKDIQDLTGSHGGSLYGISSNSPSAAFRRHPASVKDFPGLFFCGGGAHPGGGMPLVLLSGKNAADEVRSYFEQV
jgi:diapolycopene oxygenase